MLYFTKQFYFGMSLYKSNKSDEYCDQPITTFDDILITEIVSLIFYYISNNEHLSYFNRKKLNKHVLSFRDLINFSCVSKKCYNIAHSINIFNKLFKNRKYYCEPHISDSILCNIYDYFHITEYKQKEKLHSSIFFQSIYGNIKIMSCEYSLFILKMIHYCNKWSNLNFETSLIPAYIDSKSYINIFGEDVNDEMRLNLYSKVKTLLKRPNLNKVSLGYYWNFDNLKLFLEDLNDNIEILIYYGSFISNYNPDLKLDFKHLKEIKLVNYYTNNPNIILDLSYFSFCINIISLYIQLYKIDKIDSLNSNENILKRLSLHKVILIPFQQLKNVRELELKNTFIKNQQLQCLKNNEHLKVLTLKSNYNITDISILSTFTIDKLIIEGGVYFTSLIGLENIPELIFNKMAYHIFREIPNFKNETLKFINCVIGRMDPYRNSIISDNFGILDESIFLNKVLGVKNLSFEKCSNLINVSPLSNLNSKIKYLNISFTNVKYIDELYNIDHIVYNGWFFDYYILNNPKKLEKIKKLDIRLTNYMNK